MAGFTCIQNPHNFDNITRDYTPSASVRKLEEAALHCKSPYLKIFQNEPLPRNISDLRSHYRSMHLQTIISRSSIYVALNELGLSKNIVLDYSQKLISNGCGTVKLLSLMSECRLKEFGITHELHLRMISMLIERLRTSMLAANVLECPYTINDTLLAAGLPEEDVNEYTLKLESYECTTTEMLFLMNAKWLKAAGFKHDIQVEALLIFLNQDNLSVNFELDPASDTNCSHIPFSEDEDTVIVPQRKRDFGIIIDTILLLIFIELLCFSRNYRHRLFLIIVGTMVLMAKML